MNNIYTYAYLDPRKQGQFTYKIISFYYEPFYIGIGINNRLYEHLILAKNNSCTNKLKINKIKKIWEEINQDPIIIKLDTNLSIYQASAKELELIKNIGRLDLNQGPLTNLTDGGEGSFNRIVSNDTKIKISKSRKGQPAWNKGLTKETDYRIKKISEQKIGIKKIWSSENVRLNFIKKHSDFGKTRTGVKNGNWKNIDINQFIFDYKQGFTYQNLKVKYNISYGLIAKRLRQNNIPLRITIMSDEEIVKKYEDGLSYSKFRNLYHISQSRLKKALLKFNKESRKIGYHE